MYFSQHFFGIPLNKVSVKKSRTTAFFKLIFWIFLWQLFWISPNKVFVEKSRTTALVFLSHRANWAIGGYPRRTNIVLKNSISNLFSWNQCLPDSDPNFFSSENSTSRFVIGLKTEIILKKDQRRRKREIVRGKTTKIPPSEKLFPSTDEPSLFGNLFLNVNVNVSTTFDRKVRTSRRQDWHNTKLHL